MESCEVNLIVGLKVMVITALHCINLYATPYWRSHSRPSVRPSELWRNESCLYHM